MKDWSAPFDESLLNDTLLIHVPTRDAADELSLILDSLGLMWLPGERIPGRTFWGTYSENTVWLCVPAEQYVKYGNMGAVDETELYADTRRCTFYGAVQLDDVDLPSAEPLF